MKRIFILLVLLSIGSGKLQAQYNWQVLPAAPTNPYRFDDIYFLNPMMGWAVEPIDVLGSIGKIWETRNGGKTWTLNHDLTSTFYRSVGFADSLNGWIGNLGDTTVSKDTVPLYYTNDGGITLFPVKLPNPQPKGICGISVVTDSVIYAYGRFFGPPVLAMTKDKGTTWTTKDMSPYASFGLIDGWFWNKDTGFITGQDGNNACILHTVDGGNTWQTVYESTRNDTDHVWKIFFPSRNIGYGSIEYTGGTQYTTYKTYFVRTTDGGKTWTEKPFITGYDEEGCGFINDSTGWIGGWSGLSYMTSDWGNSWTLDNSWGVTTPGQNRPLPYINRFRRFGDTLMYASGNTMYKLHTDFTSPPTSSSVSTYPNPFKNKATISYILQRPCPNVVLNIYDELGNKLISKSLGYKPAGQNTYIFNNKELAPGVYFCSLITSDVTLSKKMVIIE